MTQKLAGKLKAFGLAVLAISCLGMSPANELGLTATSRKKDVWPAHATDKNEDDSDLGRPTSRRGGQSRNPSNCHAYPVALIPGNGEINIQTEDCNEEASASSDYAAMPAYTQTQQTTLWVYVPAYENPDLMAKVTLENNRRRRSDWSIPLSATAGVVCFTIPDALEAENTYAWEFQILLDEQDPSKNPKVSGFVEFTQQADEYWYDDLKGAIQQHLRLSTGTALTEMLAAQGLSSLATASFPTTCQQPIE